MKSTGVVRNIDQVGRFVIPMELRRTMGLLDPSTTLEVFTEDDDKIIAHPRRVFAPSRPFTCISRVAGFFWKS